MKKRSKLLLVVWIIGALYFVYILVYFFTKNSSATNAAESIGFGIATMLVAPHVFFVFLALIFNIIGWAISKPWAALTGAILYCVAAIMFLLYCIFVIPSIVLSFVGFARMRKAPLYSAPAQSNQAQNPTIAHPAPAPYSTSWEGPEKDWADKIAPALPLIYVVWFCGIAVGTFFLLSLIFK